MTGTHDFNATQPKVRRYQFQHPQAAIENVDGRCLGTLWAESSEPLIGCEPVTVIPDAAWDALYDRLVTAFAGNKDRWNLASLALEAIGVKQPKPRVVAEFKWRDEAHEHGTTPHTTAPFSVFNAKDSDVIPAASQTYDTVEEAA